MRRITVRYLTTKIALTTAQQVGSHSQQSMGMNGELELLPTAARYEYGTRNTSDHAGWARAIEFWEQVGWEQVWRAVEEYVHYLGTALTAQVSSVVLRTPLESQKSAGILSFYIPGQSGAALCEFLATYKTGVLVSPYEAEWYDSSFSAVRISCHCFNTIAEADRLIEGVQAYLRSVGHQPVSIISKRALRPPAEQRRLRLALVGCGQISHAHLAGIHGMCKGCVEVTVLIDPARERAEELAALVVAGGGRAPAIFTSLDEAITAEDVAKLEDADDLPLFEAVDVMLPHQLHLPITLQCLRSKKHVLLEKPLAPTVADAETILAAADRAAKVDGVVFMVAENSQYWPEVQTAVDLIDSGAIGEVLTAKACFNMRKPPAVYAREGQFRGANGENSHRPWRYDNQVAGGGRPLLSAAQSFARNRFVTPNAAGTDETNLA